MAVYNEDYRLGYQDWAHNLYNDFKNVADHYISKYNDRLPEELAYVMHSAVQDSIFLNNLDMASKLIRAKQNGE